MWAIRRLLCLTPVAPEETAPPQVHLNERLLLDKSWQLVCPLNYCTSLERRRGELPLCHQCLKWPDWAELFTESLTLVEPPRGLIQLGSLQPFKSTLVSTFSHWVSCCCTWSENVKGIAPSKYNNGLTFYSSTTSDKNQNLHLGVSSWTHWSCLSFSGLCGALWPKYPLAL